MGGILKNPLPSNQSAPESEESISEFRKQVLMNTQLNAKLTSKKRDGPAGSHVLPKDTLSLKHEQEAEERLQWNQKNLAANEVTKQQYQDIHIDEPKTPYQGAIDPNGEYYKDDDEEAELENFSLDPGAAAGAATQVSEPTASEPAAGSAAARQGAQRTNDSQADSHADGQAARRFEELRKKHYNLKEALQSRRLRDDDDDDDDDEASDDSQHDAPADDNKP